jgi:uncharacterized protein (UPF0333 family)
MLGTTTGAGDIFDATKWSDGALPSRQDPMNNTPQAVTVSKAMTNAVTSAKIDLNGFVTITSAGSVDCNGADFWIEDDCRIQGNITNCGILFVTPSNAGFTNAFTVDANVVIGATLVRVAPTTTSTLSIPATLLAVLIDVVQNNRVSLANDLACSSLTISGKLWGDSNTATAAYGVAVSGALTVNGTLNLCTGISFGSCTVGAAGTISNSTVALNGLAINSAGNITTCTITGGGSIGGGTVTGCTATSGTVYVRGGNNGGGNTGFVFLGAFSGGAGAAMSVIEVGGRGSGMIEVG